MNPDTNKFEPVLKEDDVLRRLDGQPVPDSWPVFHVGEELTLRGYRWRVAACEGSTLTLEGIGRITKNRRARNKAKRQRRKHRRR